MNPLRLYERWAWRRRCKAAGINVALAEKLRQVAEQASLSGIEAIETTVEAILHNPDPIQALREQDRT